MTEIPCEAYRVGYFFGRYTPPNAERAASNRQRRR